MVKKRSSERLVRAQQRREFRNSPEQKVLRAQRQRDAQVAKDHEEALLLNGTCPKCQGPLGWYEACVAEPILSSAGKEKYVWNGNDMECVTRQVDESVRCCPACGFVELPTGADEVVHIYNDNSPGMKISEYLYCGPGAMA